MIAAVATQADKNKRLRLIAVWIFLAVAFAAYYPRFAQDLSTGVARGGLALLKHGAECLLAGEILQVCDLQFTYPPFFALVMTPFVPLGPVTGMVAWYLITIGATIAAYLLCEVLVRRLYPGAWSEPELATLRTVSIILSIKFILAVLENQAFDTLVLLFLLIGLWALATRRDVLCGGSIAFAAAIKGSPLIFLPYLLFKRRFVAAGVFTAVFVALSFLPDLLFTPKGAPHGYFVTWLHEIALGTMYDDPTLTRYRFWVGINSNNHALRELAYQLFPHGLADPWFKPTVMAMYLPLVAAVFVMVLKSIQKGGLIAIDGAAILIAMLLLSPMTSRSHFIMLLPAYTIACAAYIRDPGARAWGNILLATSFILVTATGNDLVGGKVTDWAYAHKSIALGSLALLAYLGVIVWRYRAEPRERLSASTN
jgi:alpha-1,2-mannosyltransferase